MVRTEDPLTMPPTATSTSATLPTETPIASPNPPPTAAPALIQLTTGGCCVEPYWSPDGEWVLYIDKPSLESPVGLWGVSASGGGPELVTERLGVYSNDMTLLAYPQNGQTIVERLADGQTWTIPSGGRAVTFSTDGTQLAWTAGQSGPPFDSARRQVWVSQVDGSQAKAVIDVYGGGFSGWFPDGRLLVSGRLAADETSSSLYAVSPADGRIVLLASGGRLRSTSISPGGSWVSYLSTLSSDPASNGLWLVSSTSGEARRVEQFGASRWQDDGHLLLVPLDLKQTYHQVWQIEAQSGLARPLTDPAVTRLKIANGDWSVSPDGRQVAYVSASDHNIWLLSLPD
jgi:Tol biopolymer transport system component